MATTLDHLLPLLYDSDESRRPKTIETLFATVDWILAEDRLDLLDDLFEVADPARMYHLFSLILLACPHTQRLRYRATFIERLFASAASSTEREWLRRSVQLIDEGESVLPAQIQRYR